MNIQLSMFPYIECPEVSFHKYLDVRHAMVMLYNTQS